MDLSWLRDYSVVFDRASDEEVADRNIIYAIFLRHRPEDLIYQDTPAEWLRVLYPEALAYGPQFREMDQLLNFMMSLPYDDWERFYEASPFHTTPEDVRFLDDYMLMAERPDALEKLEQDERFKVLAKSLPDEQIMFFKYLWLCLGLFDMEKKFENTWFDSVYEKEILPCLDLWVEMMGQFPIPLRVKDLPPALFEKSDII